MNYIKKTLFSLVLFSLLYLSGCTQTSTIQNNNSEDFKSIVLTISKYYDSLNTNNEEQFIELSTKEFSGQAPSKDIKSAKLINIVSYDVVEEKNSYLSNNKTATDMYDVKCVQVVEKITYNKRWPQKKDKIIILVKETEESNWKIAQVGK